MKLLVIGTGSQSTKIANALRENQHIVEAHLATLAEPHFELFAFEAVVLVAPESVAETSILDKVVEAGKFPFIVAGATDGSAAWASASQVPCFPYPLSDSELANLLESVRRAGLGAIDQADAYRRVTLGGDITARLQSGMMLRKIVITSPKGGTGKTTLAANLAIALALCGITTYLVDADGNAGALRYHLRLDQYSVKLNMVQLLRREAERASRKTIKGALAGIASGGAFLDAFTQMPGLPTLRFLPGLITDDLDDKSMENLDVIRNTMRGLFDAGVAANGIVIMDVGINPAHPVHLAAMEEAEAIAIVIKPEVPDLSETRRWIARMINSLSGTAGKAAAIDFIGSRVKLCYNMVVGEMFRDAHELLQEALKKDGLAGLNLSPNGILPVVDAELASMAVNSSNIKDILVWRYKQKREEELRPFVEGLIEFALHFAPSIRESASRIGLLPGSKRLGKKGWGRR